MKHLTTRCIRQKSPKEKRALSDGHSVLGHCLAFWADCSEGKGGIPDGATEIALTVLLITDTVMGGGITVTDTIAAVNLEEIREAECLIDFDLKP